MPLPGWLGDLGCPVIEDAFAAALRLEADGVLAMAGFATTSLSSCMVFDVSEGFVSRGLVATGSGWFCPGGAGPLVAPGAMAGDLMRVVTEEIFVAVVCCCLYYFTIEIH